MIERRQITLDNEPSPRKQKSPTKGTFIRSYLNKRIKKAMKKEIEFKK